MKTTIKYSIVYPEIYCSAEKRGFDLKCQYLVAFKEYKDKKKESWVNIQNPMKIEKKLILRNKNQLL